MTGDDFKPGYWVAGFNNHSDTYILKIAVFNSSGPVPVSVTFASGWGAATQGTFAKLSLLTAASATSNNAIGSDITNLTQQVLIVSFGGAFTFSMPSYSVAVLEVQSSVMKS